MSRKMQVLFVKEIGQVLAAFTRAADPEGKLKVEDLAGAALPVKVGGVVAGATNQQPLFVDPASLEVATVELEEEAFVTPLDFVVSGTKLEKLGGGVPQQPLLDFDRITISMNGAVAENTKVWAQVQQVTPPPGEEPIRRFVEGEIAKDSSSPGTVELVLKSLPDKKPASIPAGRYDVLVLVAGKKSLFTTSTVPPPP